VAAVRPQHNGISDRRPEFRRLLIIAAQNTPVGPTPSEKSNASSAREWLPRSNHWRWLPRWKDEHVFVRFVVGSDGQHHKQLTGIFTEARLPRDRGELTHEEEGRLADLYAWFNDNVPVPRSRQGASEVT
jgi:hypothetical protein